MFYYAITVFFSLVMGTAVGTAIVEVFSFDLNNDQYRLVFLTVALLFAPYIHDKVMVIRKEKKDQGNKLE